MAGSSVHRATTEPGGEPAPANPGSVAPSPRSPWRSRLLEGLAAVSLTLVFFAGFLGVLSQVFPAGQDLRLLLREEATSIATASAAAGGRLTETPLGRVLAWMQAMRPSVKKRLAGGIAWIPAEPGADFRAGDGIQTGPDGTAWIAYGANRIRLERNSLVILGVPTDRSAERVFWNPPSDGVVVLQGDIAARVEASSSSAFRIGLPAGLAEVGGGDGVHSEVAVTVEPDRSARVASLTGSVRLTRGGESIAVSPGRYVKVSSEGEWSQPLPIPSTPVAESPPDGARFEYLDLPPRIRFAWQPVEGKGHWRLQVGRDEAMRDLVVDEKVRGEFLEWGRLEPGRYHWRVARVVDGVASLPSPSRLLTVDGAGVRASLSVEPVPESVTGPRLIVRGRSLPGANVFVKGEPAALADDGSFSAEVGLEPGANIVLVEAVMKGGRSVYSSHLVHSKPQ